MAEILGRPLRGWGAPGFTLSAQSARYAPTPGYKSVMCLDDLSANSVDSLSPLGRGLGCGGTISRPAWNPLTPTLSPQGEREWTEIVAHTRVYFAPVHS